MSRTQVFIISWEGYNAKALEIANSLIDFVDKAYIVYSTGTIEAKHEKIQLEKVDNSFFYGPKFQRCLAHFDGDIFFQIQADAQCHYWPDLVSDCRKFLTKFPYAVWSPEVDYTPWKTELCSLDTSDIYRMVVQTDGICWAFTSKLHNDCIGVNHAENNCGWGVEQVYIVNSYLRGHGAFRSLALEIGHPRSRGYNNDQAKKDKLSMIKQLSFLQLQVYRVCVYYPRFIERFRNNLFSTSLMRLSARCFLAILALLYKSELFIKKGIGIAK